MIEHLEETVIEAYEVLLELETDQASRSAEGKEDTLALDAVAEKAIINRLRKGDIIVTEEQGVLPSNAIFSSEETIYFIDPVDMSKQLDIFLRRCSKEGMKVREALQLTYDFSWDEFNSPVISLTAVQRGQVQANIMLNIPLGRMYVASEEEIYTYTINESSRREKINMTESSFGILPTTSDLPNKPHYGARIKQLNLQNIARHVEPGPHRILFLTDRYNQNQSVGGILSNGEKITEWIGWLAYARQANMAVVEFYVKQGTEEKDQLATPHSSIFTINGSIDISALNKHEKPARYRSLLAVMPTQNLVGFTDNLETEGFSYRIL